MKLLPLRKRHSVVKYTKVDDEDFDELNKYDWQHCVFNEKRNSGRREVVMRKGPNNISIYMSVVIMKAPKGMKVDHKNADPLDNQKKNLRVCTNAENSMNRGKPKNNTTGFKGVSRLGNKFVAAITFNKITYNLGTYSTAREAARAYDKKAYELCPEFAYLNFPKEILKTNKK